MCYFRISSDLLVTVPVMDYMQHHIQKGLKVILVTYYNATETGIKALTCLITKLDCSQPSTILYFYLIIECSKTIVRELDASVKCET